MRLSPEDFGFAHGLDLDESLQVAAWMAEDGLDFVHLSLWDVRRNTAKRPEEHAIPLFRAAIPADVRIIVAGKIWTRPLTPTQLRGLAISDTFVAYLRQFPNMVRDA